jgi:hypothetical protein
MDGPNGLEQCEGSCQEAKERMDTLWATLNQSQLDPVVARMPPSTSPTEIAKAFLSEKKMNWPSLDSIKLPIASTEGQHASAIGSAAAAAVPGTTKYSALLDRLTGEEILTSKGKKVSEFGGTKTGELCVALLGPSGSGKTRKLFEFLREFHGTYLTYKDDSGKNPGSRALTNVLSVESIERFLAHVDWWNESEDIRVFRKRRVAIEFGMWCVLVAYRSVHDEWLAAVKAQGAIGEKIEKIPPSAWLLAQLYPENFLGSDIFRDLAEHLFATVSLATNWNRSMVLVEPCVIDEAQVFGKMLPKSFNAKGDERDPRPLLSAVISGVNKALGRLPIISGTGLSLVTEWKSIVPHAADDPTYRFVFHDFRTLTEEEVRNLLVRLLNCKDDPALNDACSWLAGRPRWTTNFIERALMQDKTVSELLPSYVTEMTDPESAGSVLRTPTSFIRRLREKPDDFQMLGKLRGNPYRSMLMDAYWLSMGGGARVSRSPRLVELGIGYAQPIPKVDIPDPGVDAYIGAEPLILETARRYRERVSNSETQFLLQVQDSNADLGKRFRYVTTERVLRALFQSGPLESSVVLGTFGQKVPDSFKGEWEMPAWCFGKWAQSGAEAFPSCMLDALDPKKDVLRVWFPDNLAGPDAVVVVHNKDKTRVMLILVQIKLALSVDRDASLLTVDPSLLYHVNRGQPRGIDTCRCHVIEKYEESVKRVLSKLEKESVPVVRILVSGAAPVKATGATLVSRSRGNQQDLQIVMDQTRR